MQKQHRLTLVGLATLGLALLGVALAPTSFGPSSVHATTVDAATRVQGVHIRQPPNPPVNRPLQVVIALHGMGGNGSDFAQGFARFADENHWLVIAPTFAYGDWRDPNQIAAEDPALIHWLASYIDTLPLQVGQPVRKGVFLLGHSRGAQLAHRFSLFYPEKVAAVAALAAGTYTLPVASSDNGVQMAFPYGISNLAELTGRPTSKPLLARVQYWVGVGGNDVNPLDVPRSWDPYIGTNRVVRAEAFQRTMQSIGAPAHLAIFPGANHGLTAEMRAAACAFLKHVGTVNAVLSSPDLQHVPVF